MEIIEKLKKAASRARSDKKFALLVLSVIVGIFFVPYLTIPALILWWLYKRSKFSRRAKIIATTLLIVWATTAIYSNKDIKPHLIPSEPNGNISERAQIEAEKKTEEEKEATEKAAKEENEADEKVIKEVKNQTPTKTEAKPTTTAIPTTKPTTPPPTPKSTTASIPNETVSQKNAVKKAKSYLNYTSFSHDGLVAQLEYEQFSHTDAVYGADNSGANWNEQAAKKAKSYMEYSAFSRGSLIEQLKYEKFTQEQAEYGANAVGL